MLNWHVKKYEQKETFELDRKIYTFMSSVNECESAYWFYRMLEKLALPLQCGHVTLLGNMEQLVQEIVDYWNVLRDKLEDQKHRAWAQEEYLNRARKMKRTAAAICRNSETSKESRKELRRMVKEMQQWKISTKELEVQVTEEDALTERICDQMLSSDDGQSVDAIVGAYHFIVAHPQEKRSQKLLNEMMRILRYRKMPGLVSAVYIFHNLLYGKCKIMQKKNLSSLDACLLILADSLQVSEACGEEYREILHVRKACMGVAFQMYQREEVRCGAGVQRWKQIAEDDAELNEIKQEWVW